MAKRLLPSHDLWAVNGYRRFFGMDHWREPLRWDRKAAADGVRRRVFCASMADVFDNNDSLAGERKRLWGLIRATPHLDWLILTKRIGNVKAMLPDDWGAGYSNVWLGISVVDHSEAVRDIHKLVATPARIHFLSCEPLLGPIDASFYGIDWVIIGGESGHKARPMELHWARGVARRCTTRGIPWFMKQGSQANWPKFKDFASFPEDLQNREWPTGPAPQAGLA
jgi:protein gp37